MSSRTNIAAWACTHPQGPADRLDPEALAVRLDERAHFGRCASSSAGKNAEAALRSSLARRSSRTSPRSAFQFLALLGAQQLGEPAFVGFGLSQPLAQRLVVDAEVSCDVGNGAAGVEKPSGRRDRAALRGISSARGMGWSVPFGQEESWLRGDPPNPAWLKISKNRSCFACSASCRSSRMTSGCRPQTTSLRSQSSWSCGPGRLTTEASGAIGAMREVPASWV